jgi:hypothetical protein
MSHTEAPDFLVPRGRYIRFLDAESTLVPMLQKVVSCFNFYVAHPQMIPPLEVESADIPVPVRKWVYGITHCLSEYYR